MKFLISTILSLFIISNLHAQDQLKLEKDGVKTYYDFYVLKGKKSEEGPKELCLLIVNENDYDVEVEFGMAFFETGLGAEESDVQKFMIKAGKKIKGKKNGLCWLIDEANNELMKQDKFDWELEYFQVSKASAQE